VLPITRLPKSGRVLLSYGALRLCAGQQDGAEQRPLPAVIGHRSCNGNCWACCGHEAPAGVLWPLPWSLFVLDTSSIPLVL
jgi:hypothetical protein